ncbi:MAG: hypothetical protein ABSE04_02515 [Candidatus Microgenomates bacterium]|jgi:hypothetical protein
MGKGISKYIIGALLILAAIVIGTFALKRNSGTVLAPTVPVTPAGTISQPVVTSGGGNSNAQINNDLNSVTTNLNSLGSENTQVDNGINQKAVDPTQ